MNYIHRKLDKIIDCWLEVRYILNAKQIKRSARALSLEEMVKLDAWLHGLIRRTKSAQRRAAPHIQREFVEEKVVDNKTYRLVKVHCGKKGCKCAGGGGHGPYWYAYWSEQGKTKSKYVGKKLPQHEAHKLGEDEPKVN
jgi:hypothetical protein